MDKNIALTITTAIPLITVIGTGSVRTPLNAGTYTWTRYAAPQAIEVVNTTPIMPTK